MKSFVDIIFRRKPAKPYPSSPGFAAGVETSEVAAIQVAPKAATLRPKVLAEIARRPQTSIEIAKSLGVPFESVQPRTSELRRTGEIMDSGKRGPSRNPRAYRDRVEDRRMSASSP